jgi:hypothetical protein
MLRNVASQKWRVYAWDATTGLPKTGDAANITAKITKDHGASASTNDTNPAEVDSTNEKGYYEFDLTQAESDAYVVMLSPKSSTANIVVMGCPPVIYTRPQYFSAQSIDSNGRLDIIKVAGTTQTAGDIPALINTVDDYLDTELAALTTTVSTINSKLGSITGSGQNTVLGYFQSIARSDVTVSSDIGGTYDDASHSLQAVAGKVDVVDDYVDTEIASLTSTL